MQTLKGLFQWLVVKRVLIAVALVLLGALGAHTPAVERCVGVLVDALPGGAAPAAP